MLFQRSGASWPSCVVFQLLKISCLGLRVDEHDEFEGADTMEHNLPL